MRICALLPQRRLRHLSGCPTKTDLSHTSAGNKRKRPSRTSVADYNAMLYLLQMSAITLKLPDELAEQLRNHQDRLPEILELGLRELNAEGQGRFEGAADVLEFLATLPAPEEILKLRPSDGCTRRVQ